MISESDHNGRLPQRDFAAGDREAVRRRRDTHA